MKWQYHTPHIDLLLIALIESASINTLSEIAEIAAQTYLYSDAGTPEEVTAAYICQRLEGHAQRIGGADGGQLLIALKGYTDGVSLYADVVPEAVITWGGVL
jgi:hypothetical protein